MWPFANTPKDHRPLLRNEDRQASVGFWRGCGRPARGHVTHSDPQHLPDTSWSLFRGFFAPSAASSETSKVCLSGKPDSVKHQACARNAITSCPEIGLWVYWAQLSISFDLFTKRLPRR